MAKAFDMQKDWIINRAELGQFNVIWDKGRNNKGDYSTKHHPGKHHKQVRPVYLNTPTSPMTVQGCNKILMGNTFPILQPSNSEPLTTYSKLQPLVHTSTRLVQHTVHVVKRLNTALIP